MDADVGARGLVEPTLEFWVAPGEEAHDTSDSMGLFSGSGEAVLRSIPLGPLRKNLTEAVDALQGLFADITDRGGTLPLREVQLSFQVSASGGVQFVGTSQMQSGRGITLTFRQ